jgi:anti-sigma-K factor RskA
LTLKEYIESGMLDAYALDALSPEERVSVEAMLEQFPELRAELEQIEITLENMATEDAVFPPPASKATIWEALSQLPTENLYTPPVAVPPNRTIDFNPAPKPFNWAMAAAMVGLLLSVGGNVYLYQHRESARQELASLQSRINDMQAERGQLQQRLVTYQGQTDMLVQPGMHRIMMKPQDTASHALAAVLISEESKTAYVALKNMPPLPAGKQYQLWVLKGGKPSSMGVIPDRAIEGGAEAMILPVEGGEAYAISLENAGGVEQPTMTAIKVLGTAS